MHPFSMAKIKKFQFPLWSVLPLCMAGLGLSFSKAPTQAQLTIEGITSIRGSVRVALYNKPEGFTEPKKAVHLKSVSVESATVIVDLNVPPGRYAVAVFHDENNNGVLDKNAFGLPTEAYGFSNNARGRFGPPDFNSCVVEIGPNTKNSIKVR
jgi:uncharacterized protein (DUF2141 family)